MVAAGTTLAGRYRLDRLIGRGGMASVYAAHDEVLDRAVAVKVLHPGEPVDRTRFDREARLLAGLAHPNLLAVYDAGEHENAVFMVLELIDGPTLAARLTEGQPLARDEARRVGAALAAALACVHDEGIVHRDIKPSNVLFDANGQVRLGDFGIALLADTTALTAPDSAIGTAAYMAPEQIEGRTATAAVDVYALGLVLLECLTGERAFPGPPSTAALARLTRRPDVPDTLPPNWSSLLTAMTDRDPAERPAASVVADALGDERVEAVPPATEPLAVTAPLATPAVPSSTPTAVPAKRRRAGWAVAAAAVVLVLGAVALLTRDDGGPSANAATDVESTVPSTLAVTTTVAPTTAAPAPPPSTTPTTTAPAVDCDALEAEKDALEERKREIRDQYRDDRETRDRLTEELEARKREIDDQLRESCHGPGAR